MRSLSTVGVGLSVIFGCLALALVAEIYYLLWWKKRRITYQSRRESFCTFFWKRKPAPPSTAAIAAAQQLCSSVAIAVEEPQPLLHAPHPNWPKTLQEIDADSQLPRLQPRFLFTIKEESEEDLESDENGEEGSRSRSLNELLLLTVETPFVTPLPSPSYFTPPLTPPSRRHHQRSHHGFSPLSRSLTDAEFNRMRSSPPPKFKFLKDAEDKLYRRMLMEEAEKQQLHIIDGSGQGAKADEFITLIVAKNKDPSSSQVLPLPSSPLTFRPPIINREPVSHQISSIK